MKLSTRAALLSAFMFPGCGHIALKKHISGWIFISISAIASLFVITNIMIKAKDIANQIVEGHMPIDPIKIMELLTARPPTDEVQLLNFAMNVLIAMWLVSTLDAYRIGRKIENNNSEVSG